MPKKENTKETKKAPAKKAPANKIVEKNTSVETCSTEKKKAVVIFALILIVINVFVSIVTLTSALNGTGAGSVNYDKIKDIVKQQVLQNEYDKVGGKENFDKINEIQIPQIESSLSQYKQQADQAKAQAEEDAKPKYLTQEEVQDIIAQGYNEGAETPDYIWLEYADLQCPYCIRFANSNAADMLEQEYGDKLMHGFRHYPLNFHENALPAAEVAECVGAELGSEAYYNIISTAFANEKQDFESMIGYAKDLGANEDTVKKCANNETYSDKINSQMKYGASKFSISGTPGHVFINTKTGQYTKVSGAQGGGALINAIEQIK